jgi:hypothetical protein
MRAPKVQIREEMSVMRVTGGILAFLFLLTAQSMPVAQIGNPMPPPGAVGDPVPVKTVPGKNIDRPSRHDKVRCRSHKGACLSKPSSR